MKQKTNREQQTSKQKQSHIGQEYEKALQLLPKMIVRGLETEPTIKPKLKKDIRIIANQDGYNVPFLPEGVIKGKPLQFTWQNHLYPVGYTIFIPTNLKRATKVVIFSYGGETIEDMLKISNSMSLQRQGYHLLNKGIPVIQLNLPDLLQSEQQFNMTESLQTVVHQSINRFFETLSKHPEELSDLIEQKGFKQADYYLFGSSFGGRTVFRHGQLYPHTFKGYISHDGALTDIRDMPIVGGSSRGYKHAKEVLPIFHINDTTDPVLILQNIDDNNVNLDTAIEYYRSLIESGKQDLARLVFFEKGNAIPEEGIHNKGHFIPDSNVEHYLSTIINFMNHGPSKIPALHELALMDKKGLSTIFFRTSSYKLTFPVYAMELFKQSKNHSRINRQSPEEWNQVWANEYIPILRILKEIDTLTRDRDYLDDQLKYFQEHNLLTNDVIQKAVRYHAKAFRELYRERNDFEGLTLEEVETNPEIIEGFRNALMNVSKKGNYDVAFMFESLFMANPDLVPSFERSKCWTETSLATESEQFKKAHFQREVDAYKTAIKKSWRSLVDTTILHHRQQKKTVDTAFDISNLDDFDAVYDRAFLTDVFFVGNQTESEKADRAIKDDVKDKITGRIRTSLQQLSTSEKQSESTTFVLRIIEKHASENSDSLSESEIDALGQAIETSQDEVLKTLIWQTLLLDKLKAPIEHPNLFKGLKREKYLLDLLNDLDIYLGAHNKNLHDLTQIFPALLPNLNTLMDLLESAYSGINHIQSNGNTPLMTAIMNNDLPLVTILLEHNADISIQNRKGQTALECACEFANIEVVELLIRNGAKLTATCLELAERNNENLADLLIKNGADPFEDFDLDTPIDGVQIISNPLFCNLLYKAILNDNDSLKTSLKGILEKHRSEHLFEDLLKTFQDYHTGSLTEAETIQAIEENRLNINLQDKRKRSVLTRAINEGQDKLVQTLLDKGCDLSSVDAQEYPAVYHLIYRQLSNYGRSLDPIKQLIDKSPKQALAKEDKSYLKRLIVEKIVDLKFEYKKDIDDPYPRYIDKKKIDEVILYAIESSDLTTLVQLIKIGSPQDAVKTMGESLISSAIKAGADQCVYAFLQSGMSPNGTDTFNQNYMALAFKENNEDVALRLVQKGADVNGLDREGNPHLINALYKHMDSVAKALVTRGVRLDVVGPFGKDPLWICIEQHNQDMVQLLLESNIQVDTPNWSNTTPLIYCCKQGFFDIAELLIKHGADINARDNNGYTPLNACLEFSRNEQASNLATKLIDMGASNMVTNPKGDLPIWQAIKAKNLLMVDKLLQANKTVLTGCLNPTLLEWSVDHNDLALADLLIKHQVDINQKDELNRTVLFRCAERNLFEMAKLLLGSDIDVNAQDDLGHTALSIAIMHQNIPLAKLLLDFGADPNLKNNFGFSCLDSATEDVRQELLSYQPKQPERVHKQRFFYHEATETNNKPYPKNQKP